MFDWLFGDGGKQKKEAQAQLESLNDYRGTADVLSQVFNNRLNNNLYTDDNVGEIMNAGSYYDNALGIVDEEKKAIDDYMKKTQHEYFGNGLLGMLLNPIGQTATAGYDLATGNYEDRDAISDLGALGETALTFLPGVGLAGKGAKAFGSVKGMAGLGAGFGAANALKEGGSDTNFGDVLNQAGTGALFGGGIGFAGNKLGGMMRNRGANNIVGKYMAENPTGAKAFLENNMTGQLRNQVAKQPNFLGNHGSLYGNALGSLVPKSTFGKVAVGGAGLYGGMQLMGGGGEPDPMMAGGYDPYGANYDQYGGF